MNTTPSTLEKEYDSKGHCTDGDRLVKWTVHLRNSAGSKKLMQESATEGLHLQEGVGEPGRAGKENSSCSGDQPSKSFWAEPRLGTELGNEREIFPQSMVLLRECIKCSSQKVSATKSPRTAARARSWGSMESSWGKNCKAPSGVSFSWGTQTHPEQQELQQG